MGRVGVIRYSGDSSRQEGELEVGQESLAGAVLSNISQVQRIVEAVLIVIQYCLDIYHVGLVFNRNKISHMIPDLFLLVKWWLSFGVMNQLLARCLEKPRLRGVK